MRFADIPGHERLKDDLREMVRVNRMPHALMIAGPSGIGKMMLARAFVQYAQCEHPEEGEPCGKCNSCMLHEELSHPDVHFSFPIVKSVALHRLVSDDMRSYWVRMLQEAPAMPPEQWLAIIDAGNSQPQIHVNEAAEIVRAASYPAYSSKIKFFVIWLPERMTVEAANKLLKVVEEPSDDICFVLVSNNDAAVLPTISSRTRKLRATPLSKEEIENYLRRKWRIEEYAAMRMAPLAGGSLAKADELGSNTGESDEFRNLFQTLMRYAYMRQIGALKKLADTTGGMGREKINRFLKYFISMIRENFIYNLAIPPLQRLSQEDEKFSRNFAPFINASNVEEIMKETDRARIEIERYCSPKLVLFDFFLLLVQLIRRKPTNNN